MPRLGLSAMDDAEHGGWDCLAGNLFDEVEEARRLLDARAGLRAHMQLDLPGIAVGKKF
jgi:hypothetical protein